jgi:hypothetical protein
MDCETEKIEAAVPMHCRKRILDDGRYMIFYTFADEAGLSDPSEEPQEAPLAEPSEPKDV